MEQDTDRITNLPADVIDQILSRMPLKDAVRTSALSRNWRYKWAKIPYLVFDNQCIPLIDQTKFINIIDRVLLLHNGPIYKFKLSRSDFQVVADIDRWILFMSRKSIKEFVLHIWEGEGYKMHNSLFFCDSLIHLDLYKCELKPPSTFTGFKNLKSLSLYSITLDQGLFEKLITSSSMLEKLTLYNNGIVQKLSLCPCASLKYLTTDMYFEDLNKSLASFPNLQELEIKAPMMMTCNGVHVDFQKKCDGENSMFVKIRQVKIVNVSSVRTQLGFIKFVLLNSPVLEKMTIKPVSSEEGLKLLKELVRYRLASTAEIIYLDPCDGAISNRASDGELGSI